MRRTFWFILYNTLVIPVLYLLAKVAASFVPKVYEGLKARRVSRRQWKEELDRLNREEPGRRRLLFHATSVGEWEQAAPLIERIKSDHPKAYIVVSFYSPSGFNYVKRHPDVDLKVYLPFDLYSNAREFLAAVKPDLWVISKFDVWPNHMFAAKKMGIPVVMIAATLSSNSRRNRGLTGALSRAVYPLFDMIFPISQEDRDRFFELYPYEDRLYITGDTRFDRVYEKGERAKSQGPVTIFRKQPELTFIAGSIWPADEKHLLPALTELLREHSHMGAILVPHELHEEHIADIQEALDKAGLNSERYTELESGEGSQERVVIVDTIGMLARLYMQTDLAYVGGSFRTGVHNVMEPATFAQPVVFGPVHENSFEALELLKLECAFTGSNKDELKSILSRLIKDDAFRRDTGQRAHNLIKDNLGATEKIYRKLKENYDTIS